MAGRVESGSYGRLDTTFAKLPLGRRGDVRSWNFSRGRGSSFRNESGIRNIPWSQRLPESIPTSAEEQRGLVLIVGPAPKLDVLHCRPAALGKRHDVVEFEKRLLGAATASAMECALSGISFPEMRTVRHLFSRLRV
jgi:hypothetical protein